MGKRDRGNVPQLTAHSGPPGCIRPAAASVLCGLVTARNRVGRATTMFTNTYRLSAMLAGLIFGVVQIAGYRFSYLIEAGLCTAGLALLSLTRPNTHKLSSVD